MKKNVYKKDVVTMASYIPACYTGYLNSATELTCNEYDWSTQENCADFTTGAMTLTKFKEYLNALDHEKLSITTEPTTKNPDHEVYRHDGNKVSKWLYEVLKKITPRTSDPHKYASDCQKAIAEFEKRKANDKGSRKMTVAGKIAAIKKKCQTLEKDMIALVGHGHPQLHIQLRTEAFKLAWTQAKNEYRENLASHLDLPSKSEYNQMCRASKISLLNRELEIWTQEQELHATDTEVAKRRKFIEKKLEKEQKKLEKEQAKPTPVSSNWDDGSNGPSYWNQWRKAKKQLIVASKNPDKTLRQQAVKAAKLEFTMVKKNAPGLKKGVPWLRKDAIEQTSSVAPSSRTVLSYREQKRLHDEAKRVGPA